MKKLQERLLKQRDLLVKKKAESDGRRRDAENDAKRRADEEEARRREAQALRDAEDRIKADAAAKAARRREKEERKRAKEDEERRRLAELDDAKRHAETEERERAFEEERRRLEEENRRLKESLLAAKAKLIGRLQVTVLQARGLRQKADAYCALFCERQKERTKTVKKTKEPKWNGEFEFYVSEKDATLDISVFHRVWLFSDDFLGCLSITVSDLQDGQETNEWYALKSRKKKDTGSRGELKLRLLYKLEN